MDETERELHWLRRVRDLSQRLASERDLVGLLPLILDAAIELAQAERGFLVRVRGHGPAEDDWDLTVEVARGVDRAALAGPEGAVSRTVVDRVLRLGHALVTNNQADRELLELSSVQAQRVVAIACLPLQLRGEQLGVLYLDHRLNGAAFSASDLPNLQTFADQAAVSLETAQLLAERVSGPEPLAETLLSLDALRRATEEEQTAPESLRFGRLTGSTPVMCALYEDLVRAAATQGPALVFGEQGTERDAVAREIHDRSACSGEPFLTLNCATARERSVADELFGFAKGFRSWSSQGQRGLLTLAGKGSVFVDEVEALEPEAQAALVRVLRDGEVQPGGARATPVGCRVIAGTSADLRARASAGFRQDLYYLLDVMRVVVPPLRQRPADLPQLIARAAEELELRKPRVSPKALELLQGYSWPGNLVELRNEVQRLASLRVKRVSAQQLSAEVREGRGVARSPQGVAGKTLSEVERQMVETALQDCGGNKTRAARQLGIARGTLYHLIDRYELQ